MRVLRRYGYRVVAAWFLVALVASVGADLGIGVRPASADGVIDMNDPDWWGYDTAQGIQDACGSMLEFAGDQMGSGSATLGFVGPPGAAGLGGGLVSGSGAAAGTTTVAATAGTVGLLAADFVGVGCGTIGLYDFLFGPDDPPTRPLTSSSFTVSDLEPCEAGTPGATPTDRCLTVVIGSTGYDNSEIRPAFFSYDSGPLSGWWVFDYLQWRQPSGVLTNTSWPTFGSDQTVVIPMPCESYVTRCGLNTWDTHTPKWVPAFVMRNTWGSGWGKYVGPVAIPGVTDRGYSYSVRADLECKRPSDGDIETVSGRSDSFSDSEPEVPSWEPPACPSGYAAVDILVTRDVATGGGTSSLGWTDDPREGPVLDWAMDPAIKANPTSLQCWVDGLSTCPIWTDPGNPSAQPRIGGATGVEVGTGPKVSTLVPPVIEAAPWPPEDPNPAPTTTAVPTTTATTLPPPTTVPDGGCEGNNCVGGPNGPPGGEGGECFPSGWGWLNPVEWVLKPIKCALVWAFWDQDSADEISALGDEHGWTDLVTESSVTTSTAAGPCVDMDYADICTEPILSAELPSAATVLLTAAVLFFGLFEVIGLFARITGGL